VRNSDAVRPANLIGSALLAIACVVVLESLWMALAADQDFDFRSYSTSAARWAGGGSIYAPDQLEGSYTLAAVAGHVFVYPPPALLLLLPFAMVPGGMIAWLLLSTAVLISGLAAIVRLERGKISAPWIAAITCVVASSLPFIESLTLGNASILIAGLLAWAYVGRAGIIGGLAGIFKVTPGVMASLDGLQGAAVSLVNVAVIAFVTLPIVGVAAWHDFATAMSNGQPSCQEFESIACATAPVIGMGAAKILTLAIAAGIALSTLVVSDRRARLALVTLSLLAATPEIRWPGHYWLYVYPLIVASVARWWQPTSRSRLAEISVIPSGE